MASVKSEGLMGRVNHIGTTSTAYPDVAVVRLR